MAMKKYKTMHEYLDDFPPNIRKILKQLSSAIKSAAPQTEETMAYGVPTYKLNGNLVHFGAFKSHIGFFPTPSAIVAFKKELSKYNLSKGTVQFPLDKPLPIGIIKRIVKYRVKQNLSKKH
jgi:uncharacterized protein YdhG (YjbR/CyaY superfamily)